MPLMDALRSGVDLINASNQGVQEAAKARYAYPMTQAELARMRLANTYQGIINQYQPEQSRLTNQGMGLANNFQQIVNQYAPEKLRLGNQYQGLINNNYQRNIDSEINSRNEETKFTPLKYAIQAQNSIRNNSRFGGAYQYLKSVADLPAAQRSIFLGDPTNKQQYMDMITQLHDSISNQNGTQVISPELLKKVGLAPITGDVVSNAPPPRTSFSPQPQGGLGVSEGSVPPQISRAVGGISAPLAGAYTPLGGVQPMPNNQAPQMGAPSSAPPQSNNNVANDAKDTELTPKDRELFSFQMRANEQLVGQKITNQALSAIAYHKLITQNQDRFAPAFENAAKYAGLLGQGKLSIDKFKSEHPAEYADYTWVTNDLIPALGQNIRRIEGLAATDGQREALNEMYLSVLNWKSDPEMAINNMNKTMRLFNAQAKAVLETAQPVFPGVLEKLNNVKPTQRDYVGTGRFTNDKKTDLSSLSDEELMKIAGGK